METHIFASIVSESTHLNRPTKAYQNGFRRFSAVILRRWLAHCQLHYYAALICLHFPQI
jgi:hypothetical protein